MDVAVLICSIIAAFGSIFSYLMWRDSRRCILRRIEKRVRKIKEIQNYLYRKYKQDYSMCAPSGPLYMKMSKLQSEIGYLKKLL